MANPFYFRNGEEAKNLDEFYTLITKVKASEFDFHVGENKNDFADWIQHLGKKTLAKKVRKQENITQLRKLLKKELKGSKTKSTKTKKKKTKSKKKSTTKSKKKSTTKSSKKKATSAKKTKKKPKKEHSRSKTYQPKSLEETSQNLERQYQISTEAPHTFILKEFLFGAFFGLVLGLILTAIVIQSGVLM